MLVDVDVDGQVIVVVAVEGGMHVPFFVETIMSCYVTYEFCMQFIPRVGTQ